MLKLKKIIPAELTPDVLEQIIKLIQTKFIIKDEVAAEIVKEKHTIHLYTDVKRNKLVGVIGFRQDLHNNNVYLYIGASVVDDDYQKCGILSKSLKNEVINMYFKYSLKRKYAVAFCTTPEAYQYFCFLDQFWPNQFSETPAEVIALQKEYAVLTGVNDYTIENGAIINHELRGKIQGISSSPKVNRKVIDYFNGLIAQDHQGDQIFCIAPINYSNCMSLLGRCIKKYFSRIAKSIYVDKLFVSRK